MDKITIDKIVWWIPIKSLRNKFREKMYSNIISNPIIDYNSKVKTIYKHKTIKLIQLETHNRCNNDCQFCPVSIGNEKREYHKMSEELFIKIMNNLSKMNYNQSISLFDNNEPFLDTRIVDFFRIAKEKLPNAFHYIMTNGLIVSLEQFKESYKYLDMFLIDNYNNDGELNPKTKIIYDFCMQNPEYKEKTVILMRRKDEILTSRAGNSPNRQNTLEKIKNLCSLPYWQFHIRPDGKISLCCNDAWGQMTLGDLNNNTVEEIFNSQYYNKICKKLLKGRDKIKICEYCDYVDDINRTYNRIINNTASDSLIVFKNYQTNIIK